MRFPWGKPEFRCASPHFGYVSRSVSSSAGHRLFPMAAPTGGVVLIASWLALGVAAVVTLFRPG